MYIPAAFRQEDIAALHSQMRASHLPLLVSHGSQGLLASSLPLLLDSEEGRFGTLYGHFARANPQWRDLAEGGSALVVFQGPDAYVSPSWCATKAEHGKVVPTWNYVSIQASGRAEVFDDAERLLRLVSRLSDAHEAARPQPWAVSDAPDAFIEGQLKAIVGFALPIERLEGKWKLSQNRSLDDQAGVQAGLIVSQNSRDRELAALMNPNRREDHAR